MDHSSHFGFSTGENHNHNEEEIVTTRISNVLLCLLIRGSTAEVNNA